MSRIFDVHNLKYNSLWIVIVLFLTGQSLLAQDVHFSQFYHSPMNINPALTGQFHGSYRFIANQRTQWRSVTTPYSTLALSADCRKLFFKDFADGKPTAWNAGLAIISDKAGDSKLKSTSLNLSLSRNIPVLGDDRAFLIPGVALGFTSMSIDYTQLKYDNQWNGAIYDPNLDAQERYSRDSRVYLNLSAGVSYYKRWNKNREIILGIGSHNLNRAKQSFFDSHEVKLDTRYNIHGQYKFAINKQWLAQPSVNYMIQGRYKEFNMGALAHYIFEDISWTQRSVYMGYFGRIKDAGYIVTGIQYDEWNIGISYDINMSNLKPASNGKGGFEVSVVYIIAPRPEIKPKKVCPDFL
jgi:type IX secretion system PorP/SprF family membrane protein